MAADRLGDRPPRFVRGGPMEAGMVAVVAMDDAVEHAGRVARALLRQGRMALEQDRGPTAFGLSACEGAAGEAATDDRDRQAFVPVSRCGVEQQALARPGPRHES